MDIDQTKDESGEREAAETERSRIGELAEQPLVRFRIKVLSRRRKNGRLVGLSLSAGVSGFAAVVEVVVSLEIAGAIVFMIGKGRHCESELEPRRLNLEW